MKKRYRDDAFAHPDFYLDLWMEARSTGGAYRNRVYGLANDR
jgi:hypothetical protein